LFGELCDDDVFGHGRSPNDVIGSNIVTTLPTLPYLVKWVEKVFQ
jgi:hypothetical protein